MKKLLVFAVLFVLLVIIGVGIFAVVNILSLSGSNEESPDTSQIVELSSVEQYAAENYPDYKAVYAAESKTLTLEKKTDFSLASAQNIYSDHSTYLSQAQLFALDISIACDEPDLVVVLWYLSKDNEPMLKVASNGVVNKYW